MKDNEENSMNDEKPPVRSSSPSPSIRLNVKDEGGTVGSHIRRATRELAINLREMALAGDPDAVKLLEKIAGDVAIIAADTAKLIEANNAGKRKGVSADILGRPTAITIFSHTATGSGSGIETRCVLRENGDISAQNAYEGSAVAAMAKAEEEWRKTDRLKASPMHRMAVTGNSIIAQYYVRGSNLTDAERSACTASVQSLWAALAFAKHFDQEDGKFKMPPSRKIYDVMVLEAPLKMNTGDDKFTQRFFEILEKLSELEGDPMVRCAYAISGETDPEKRSIPLKEMSVRLYRAAMAGDREFEMTVSKLEKALSRAGSAQIRASQKAIIVGEALIAIGYKKRNWDISNSEIIEHLKAESTPVPRSTVSWALANYFHFSG